MMRKAALLIVTLIVTTAGCLAVASFRAANAESRTEPLTVETTSPATPQSSQIFIHTEDYPRPPYSGATYYIYERDDEVICTKLEVCNKYDECSTTYRKGAFKEEEDVETGEPYGGTDPVPIPKEKLRRHRCLTKFKLIK